MPPRPRTPSPEEARLLTVYLDAERYLLETVRREVVDVADLAQAGEDVEARRVVGIRRVREAAERVALGLERGAPARVETIIGAAAEQGVDEAVRQLGAVTGLVDDIADYADPINRAALDRLAASTVSTLTPAHMSILRTVPDAYRTAVERTVSGVLVGAQTRREASQRALWSLADQGVTSFTDRAGRRWRLSSYAEMATRTAAARAHVDAQLDRLAAAGFDLVQVSDVARECPLCRPWEGRILSHGGGPVGNVEIPNPLTGEPVTVTVSATVDQARGAGLLHPNCRHSLSLYLAGVTPPMRPRERRADPDGYNAGQRQREIERHIRAWKSRAAAAVDTAGRRRAEQHVRAWQAEMRAHLAANPGLKRLRYREQIGAGNLPTIALRERVGTAGPTPTLVKGKARTPRQMTDAELERRMRTALAREDYDTFERLADETDRRDTARAAARDRRAAARAAREARKAEEFDRLLSQGVDEESAVEIVYGLSVERQRRQRAIAGLRADGYTGRGFDELSRQAYRDHVWQRYRAAEDATNGHMLTRQAETRGVDPLSLFTGPEHVARANASDELLEWWDMHGRPTLEEFRVDLLGDTGAARALRSSRGEFLT